MAIHQELSQTVNKAAVSIERLHTCLDELQQHAMPADLLKHVKHIMQMEPAVRLKTAMIYILSVLTDDDIPTFRDLLSPVQNEILHWVAVNNISVPAQETLHALLCIMQRSKLVHMVSGEFRDARHRCKHTMESGEKDPDAFSG